MTTHGTYKHGYQKVFNDVLGKLHKVNMRMYNDKHALSRYQHC